MSLAHIGLGKAALVAALFSFALGSCCFSGPSRRGDDASPPPIAGHIGFLVGEFRYQEWDELPGSAGYALVYNRRGYVMTQWFTLYVYPQSAARAAATPAQRVLDETEEAVAGVRSFDSSARLVGCWDGTEPLGVPAQLCELELVDSDVKLPTFVAVGEAGGYMLKVRATSIHGGDTTMRDAVISLVRAFFLAANEHPEALRWGSAPTPAPTPRDDDSVAL